MGFLRPRRLAPARTPSTPHAPSTFTFTPLAVQRRIQKDGNVHGGSVTIASKNPPHRNGFRVTSNVHRSSTRVSTAYCFAARIIPGLSPACTNARKHSHRCVNVKRRGTRLCRASAAHRYPTRIPWRQNALQYTACCPSPRTGHTRASPALPVLHKHISKNGVKWRWCARESGWP